MMFRHDDVEGNVMDIFYGCDDTYAQHLCVSINSVLSNTLHPVTFHVLDGGITPAKKQKIARLVSGFGHGTVNFLAVDNGLFAKLPVSPRFSISSYYRCIIHELMPNLSKALYLDSDVVIRTCIKELYDTDLTDCYAAVVEDPNVVIDRRKNLLDIATGGRYFNSGVMLLNLKKIRDDNVFARMGEVVDRYGKVLDFYDQDILNILFKDRVVYVDPSWNIMELVYRDNGACIQHRFYAKDHYDQCCNNPKIIHYANRSTPWFAESSDHFHKFWLEYFRYLRGTGFYRGMRHHPLVLLFRKRCTTSNLRKYRKWLIQIRLTSRAQVVRIFGVYLVNRRRAVNGEAAADC
jgi:lipopolysaccharide biosynthesis glycosyltransferase